MKKFPSILLSVLLSTGFVVATSAQAMPEPVEEFTQEQESYTDAELDSILAPVALYPDSVLTHILIAATYPLEVIAAHRWREDNAGLSAQEVEIAVEDFGWDPSVKALAPFAEVLATMSDDLDWLQALGDNVLVSQSRVLSRVQVLREQALNSGSLKNSEYLAYDRTDDVIVIEPTRREVVYIPYYDTRVVYGNWGHPVAPVYWHRPAHYVHHADFYWSPSVRLSSFFYFGGIHWHNRYVVVTHSPVRNYYRGPLIKRVHSREYQRWQHNTHHRHSRYSKQVTRHLPDRRVVQTRKAGQLEYRDTLKRHTVPSYKQRRNEPVDARQIIRERKQQSEAVPSPERKPAVVRAQDQSRSYQRGSSNEKYRHVNPRNVAGKPAEPVTVRGHKQVVAKTPVNSALQRKPVQVQSKPRPHKEHSIRAHREHDSRSQVRTKER